MTLQRVVRFCQGGVLGLAMVQVGCGPLNKLQVPDPVYNVAVSPQVTAATPDTVGLRAGAPSTLQFGIGARWPTSVIPPQSPNPAITTATTDMTLTAVLACAFCEEHPPFMRKVTYSPSTRRSNVVEFPFVPRQPTVEEGDAYNGSLELAVYGDSTEQLYDRVVVPVAVTREGAVTDQTAAPRSPRLFGETAPLPLDADVVLRVYLGEQRQLLMEINPLTPDVQDVLGPLVIVDDRLRAFRTAPIDAAEVSRITTGVYVDASAISLQGELAEKLGHTGKRASVSAASRETLRLTRAESSNLTSILAETGRSLYGRLFADGEDGLALSDAIRALEGAHTQLGRPVRLHIRSDHLALPWQYLHPIGVDPDPARFWGMVFDLSVERVHGGGPSAGLTGSETAPRTLLFARYGSERDVTVDKAVQQVAQLRSLSGANVVEVRSRDQLMARLASPERASVSAVVTFLHASAGGRLPGREPDEPVILFGATDVLTSRSLLSLRDHQTVEQRRTERYLPAAPLFILNACETGPSTVAIPYRGFQETAFALGAQGLVVTEVSVWVSLGHEVGTRLIKKLGSGETVNRAMSSIRRELLQERNNPLGLLYAYYGDPGATLRR